MDNFFEILIPIIFFLIWIVGNLRKSFSKKKQPLTRKERTHTYHPQVPPEVPQPEPAQRPFEDFHGVDIEEEIRRRIEERQDLKKKPAPKPSLIPKLEIPKTLVSKELLILPLVSEERSKIDKLLIEQAFTNIPVQMSAEGPKLSSKLHQIICNQESLRSAIILSEILGEPVALRKSSMPCNRLVG